MDRLQICLVFILLGVVVAEHAIDNEQQEHTKDKRFLLNRKPCVNDSDCSMGECCTMYFGKSSCRPYAKVAERCKTWIGHVVGRIHKWCPCEPGLECRHIDDFFGYKIYRCSKDNTNSGGN